MIQRILFWIVWYIPLGKLAPYVMGLALGSKPQKRGRWNEKKKKKNS